MALISSFLFMIQHKELMAMVCNLNFNLISTVSALNFLSYLEVQRPMCWPNFDGVVSAPYSLVWERESQTTEKEN